MPHDPSLIARLRRRYAFQWCRARGTRSRRTSQSMEAVSRRRPVAFESQSALQTPGERRCAFYALGVPPTPSRWLKFGDGSSLPASSLVVVVDPSDDLTKQSSRGQGYTQSAPRSPRSTNGASIPLTRSRPFLHFFKPQGRPTRRGERWSPDFHGLGPLDHHVDHVVVAAAGALAVTSTRRRRAGAPAAAGGGAAPDGAGLRGPASGLRAPRRRRKPVRCMMGAAFRTPPARTRPPGPHTPY